jgi:hypothetical protein
MEMSNENKNRVMQIEACEIFMNEVEFENDIMEESKENSSLQIE